MSFPTPDPIDWSVVGPRRGEKFFAMVKEVCVKIRVRAPAPLVMEARCALYVSDARLVFVPERGRVVGARQIDAVECELAGLEGELLRPHPHGGETVEFAVREGFGRAGRFELACEHPLDLFILLLALLLHARFTPARTPHVLLLTEPGEVRAMCERGGRPLERRAYAVEGCRELFLCEERPDAGPCAPHLSRRYGVEDFEAMVAALGALSERKQAEEQLAVAFSASKAARPRPARALYSP